MATISFSVSPSPRTWACMVRYTTELLSSVYTQVDKAASAGYMRERERKRGRGGGGRGEGEGEGERVGGRTGREIVREEGGWQRGECV